MAIGFDQRPTLIRQDGFHVPGGDAGLHQHQDRTARNGALNRQYASGFPPRLLLCWHDDCASYGPAEYPRNAPPGWCARLRGTWWSFYRRRGFQDGAPFRVTIKIVVIDSIWPSLDDARLDRSQGNIIGRQRRHIDIRGSHLTMQSLQCRGFSRHHLLFEPPDRSSVRALPQDIPGQFQ